MIIQMGKRQYEYTDKDAKEVLRKASEKVKCGLYAIGHSDKYIELVYAPLTKTQTKKIRRDLKKQGKKAYVVLGA